MRWIVRCLTAGLCMMPVAVLAAGVATVHTGERTLTVSFEGGNARVDISGVGQGYLLLRGDQLYTIMRVNGQPLVLDARNAAGLLGAGQMKSSADMIQSLTHLASTGGHQTVAGLQGDIYTVTYQDMQGRSRTGQGVLGPQPPVRELTEALGRMALLLQSSTQQSAQGTRQVLDALKLRGMGLLAYQSQFRVEKISATPPAPGLLDLPSSPAQLPGNLGQLLQGLSPQQPR